jgi:2',3'-cyclic-nucleotide 2'-phosphodiesterase (5'-nucleotidase family)
VAFVAETLYLDRPNARHASNALGQAAADAFVDVFSRNGAPVDFGVINGGSLRAEAICGAARNVVRAGPLDNGTLHEILLFENIVNAVDLSEAEVFDVFEHSVERLFPAGTPINSPAGSFLHVSKEVSLEVDCSRPAGMRVTRLSIGGRSVTKPGAPFTEKKFRVALSAFLLGGGDGYTMLAAPGKDPDRNPAQAQSFGSIDSNITEAFLRATYNSAQPQGLKLDAARIKLTGCAIPTPPVN